VRIEHLLDLPGGVGSLGQQPVQGRCQLRQDEFGGTDAGDGDVCSVRTC
jgi:hypothetical protein